VGNPIKKLAGQTAIYGLSSIVGRFLNYLLTPYWIKFGEFSTDQFGVITEMYAYVAFLVVFLTYGMETTYFRYSSKKEYDSKNIYSTILPTVIFSSFSFIILSSFFFSRNSKLVDLSGA
jgi:O-antigen/teichoic acid export membrane protein